ncbi:hypothetical protein [Rufibacter sp. XAAS-G3-1]|uniref:hypothetical protein n=1 Tax=Rufibacter sp. XAAS-G3-1 TaxID=2729134 RepID=UPI0015E68357|nr:hypothetical protein [Rufibacter sp. XAAS-G3-1]
MKTDINPDLGAIAVDPKSGQETFTYNNQKLNFNLLDFWSWSQSDLLSNSLRGVLAEFIVKQDVGLSKDCRVEWDACDLVTESGLKIEVKSSAYLQSWKQSGLSKICFDIAPTFGWDYALNQYSEICGRQSDFYVFCLLHHQDKSTVDPANLDQWTFYVLPTRILNEQKIDQKSITLGALLKLKPIECKFGRIKETIDSFK